MGDLVTAPLQLAGSIIQGNAANAQAKERAAEIARDAKLAGITATEQQSSRLENLNRTIGAIRALSAQRGLSPDDPSGVAITDAANLFTDRNNQRDAFNRRQGLSSADMAAQAARTQGGAAATSAYLSGAGSFLKTIDNAALKAASGGAGG